MSDAIETLNAALRDRYRTERQIGEGGMATVYLADDLRHGRRVALKVLKPALAAALGAERFLAEIRTTAGLQHPHILPLYDSGEAESFLFYVMPYVEGESLKERLDREHQLPVDEAVRIAQNVAEALAYAHSQGVIHRDVKPANILLQAGKPVVSDFGIALAMDVGEGARLTETGLSLGTPHYMSPEQATGDLSVGASSDVYALGCVLYEMLVGEPPYTGSSPQAILGKIIAGRIASPTEVRESVPQNVDAAIRRALEKVPADRFNSAEAFATALGDPGFTHRDGAARTVVTRRGLWNPLSVAFLATTILTASVAAWSFSRPRSPLPPTSRLSIELPTGLEVWSGGGVGFDISPDGSQVVFVGTSPAGGTQLWLRPLSQLLPTAIPRTPEARNPRFSPDGTAIAYTGGGALTVVSLTGGPQVTVVPDSVPDVGSGVDWGPDGTIYFRKLRQGIWRVSPDGRDEQEVAPMPADEVDYEWLDVLPNGKGILVSRDLGSQFEDVIGVLSLETGEARTLLQGAMARYAESGHVVYATGDGSLWAAPFDPELLEVTGPSRTLLQGVEVRGGSASHFALSATGSLLYRPSSTIPGGTPVWVSRDGTEEVLDPSLRGSFGRPAVSPDGRRIAFEYSREGAPRDIWLYDLSQETFSRVTDDGGSSNPFWSPGGDELGFSSARDGSPSLYAWSPEVGGDPRLLVRSRGRALAAGLWTRDGLSLVFQEGGRGGPSNLLFAPPYPDSTPTMFSETPNFEGAPSLSPNGRWLAYHSDESGQREVYVRPFPGPGGGQVLVSAGGGHTPLWARAGEILYVGLDGFLHVAVVRAEGEFTVESRRPVTSWGPYQPTAPSRQYDLSADGERILAIRLEEDGGAMSRDVVVQGFFGELRDIRPD